MKHADHRFQRLCHEAVIACGSDMAAVERYIFERIETMDPADRTQIKQDLARVLSFQAPTHSLGRSH